MKKLFSTLAILMMAMTAWADAITAVQPTEGDGQSGTPYKIASAANLVWFAQQVNGGQTSINAKLTTDIDLGDDQTMIGKGKNYAGIFDGDGHTVTVNYTATANNAALFCSVGNATIKNLKTAGSVTSGYKFAAGIVAIASGTVNISNCASSVVIKSTYTSAADATHGGIVAYNGSAGVTHLTNVLFNGKLLGQYATNCGGLIGYTNSGASKITNCLFNPSEVTVSTTNAQTLARGNNVTITNSFYSKTLGGTTNQGTQVTTNALSKGEVCYKLNGQISSGTLHWYQNINSGQTVDDAPVLDNTHGTVYFGVNTCPASTGYSNKIHTGEYNQDGEKECGVCHHIDYQEPGKDANNNYLIGNKGNLCWFANKINAGDKYINAKLTADVSLGSNNNMIGTNSISFHGTFDGQNHTITVNYTPTQSYTALFRYADGATIKNLRTAGSITTGNSKAAGIVACITGKVYITNCASSVAITSNFTGSDLEAEHGGIAAYNAGGTLYLTNVLFDGKLLGNVKECGGLIGRSDGTSTITNGLFMPSEVTISADQSNTMGGANVTVNNSYYVSALGTAQGTQVTAQQLRLGDVCYLLNGNTNTGTLVWTQNLETDAYPTFGTAGLHYARTMSNQWGTVVLPYAIDYSQSNGNYKLYKLSAASASTLTFTEYADGTIAAGTPMAVKKISGDGIDIKPANTPNYSTTINTVSDVTGWTMNGTFTNLTNQENIYFIASNQFWWAESPITIAPFRAWFTGPAPTSSVKAFNIEIDDDDVTGIHEIVNGKLSNGKYLENGKVVIVRNGKKYNLNGQLIQ